MLGMDRHQFSRFEERIQALVEGGFSRLFAGRLQPREVALRLAHAIEDHARVSGDGNRAAPNRYAVHLHPADAAALMAGEAPHLWAATRYREWLRGHVHHSASMFYPITSDSGVTARVIPAMCPPDEYHILHGFVGSHRAAEVLYYHREYGPAGSFPVFVDEVAPAEVSVLPRKVASGRMAA